MTEQRDAGRGLDVLYTKVAVDYQNLAVDSWEATLGEGLAALQPAVGAECAFFAMFDASGERIVDVHSVSAPPADAAPDKLKTLALRDLPWLASRLAPLKLSEILDSHYHDTVVAIDYPVFKMASMRAVLVISVCVNGRPAGLLGFCDSAPRDRWDPNLHLLLKLIGSSLASGLERLHTSETVERERERNELALYSANDGLWDFDTATNKVYFSPRWKRMLGYDENAEQRDLPEWRALVHPDDLARVQAGMRDHLDGRTELFESVHRMRHRNGEWRWMLSRAKARPDKNGRLRRLVGVELDITERKLYEEALFREKESAQITLQSIGDGVITTDADCLVEYLNPVAEGLTGWKLDDAAGRPVDDIFRGFHEETCEPLENALAVSIRRKRAIKSIRPTLLIRRDGNELYIESTASPIRDGTGAIAGGVLVFHDVSESRELNRRLSYHASHDILTGLVNRREFESRLERALEKAKAGEASYAVCYMDLDQFKMVNDSCGHTAGDELLSQLGALLKSKIRWRDTLARLGGDEFGLLIEACTIEESMEIAEGLRQTIDDFKFVWDDRTFPLGVSIGLVPVTDSNEDMAGVLSAADSACAAAKDAGRNRIHCFRENDIEIMRRRREMQWAARINNALDEDRFELFRQYIEPLSKSPDGERGDHYELLLRMRDSNGALISPDVFIAAAERYSITPAIDRWVITHALDWLLENPDELGKLAMCSINLSGQSLGDDKFLPFVINEFKRRSLDGTKICFEITETAAVQSFSQANRFINSLKELGCKFALDDFGTGLSSFAYLKSFPVDFLKIDGSFVKGILHDPIDREMVRSINSIGKLTGKKTIAEFAENSEIIEQLRELGVDYAQGYGVAEPRRVSDSRIAQG
jgi:diguanylate cyclase (GGDEF)-like protein/PAS domain S-box-containing protein